MKGVKLLLTIVIINCLVVGLVSGTANNETPCLEKGNNCKQNKFIRDDYKISVKDKSSVPDNKILLRNRYINTSNNMYKFSVDTGYGTYSASNKYYIVQFKEDADKDWTRLMKKYGGEVHEYIPYNAYIIEMKPSTASNLIDLKFVQWIGEYLSEYKINPELKNDSGVVFINVILFDSDNNANNSDKIRMIGGEIIERAGNKLVVRTNISKITDIASIDDVSWIEKYSPPILFNNIAANITNVSYINMNYELNGSGQIIAVADTGLDTGYNNDSMHPDLQGRIVNISDLSGDGAEDYNGHGTHVAGSVLGNGSASNGKYHGMAPDSELYFQAIHNNDSKNSLSGIPANLTDLFQQAYDNNARIHSNSWGYNFNHGDYTSSSQDIDTFMWNHKDMLILFAAGNYRDFNNSTTICPPSTAKNCLTVGASENHRPDKGDNADNIKGIAEFSSKGPTSDGRIKPDLVAPGTYIASTRSSLLSSNEQGIIDEYYMYKSGTSMSTPITSGAAALVRQYYVDNENITPSSALLKATLINGAYNMTPGENGDVESQPDFSQGWGRLDVKKSLERKIHYSDDILLNNSESAANNYSIINSSIPLKITLTWTDPPAQLSADKTLVNDLNLIVTGPNNTTYLGNGKFTNGTPDNTNNVEQVSILNPVTGEYTVEIEGKYIDKRYSPQPCSIVLSGATKPSHLDLITISPSNKSVYEGKRICFYAETLNKYGKNINSNVNWSTSNTTVGTINKTTGIFTAMSPGVTLVNASSENISNSTKVIVKEKPHLASVNITTVVPEEIPKGHVLNFTAGTFDQYGNPFDLDLNWHSSNTTVGTINSTNGSFNSSEIGDTTVYWTNSTGDFISGQNIENNITVNVVERILKDIKIEDKTINIGENCKFEKKIIDQFGDPFEANLNWSCSNSTVGIINNTTGHFKALNSGTASITASSGSINGTATLTVLKKPSLSSSNNPDSNKESSSSGGGSGGDTGENYNNIKHVSVQKKYVQYGREINYEFDPQKTLIKNIRFEAIKSAGKVETRLEVLKDKSSLVDIEAHDKVYRNINIWVGKAGFSHNIKNPVIDFQVEKSWIANNDINESTIKMARYHNNTWNELTTQKIDENNEYIQYQSQTPGFSPFAITGEVNSIPVNDTDKKKVISGSKDHNITKSVAEKTEDGKKTL